MLTDTTIARALKLYSQRIEVPLHSLAVKLRPPGERPLPEGMWALNLCEREDALQAFLAGQQHFSIENQVLIEWVLDLARREAQAEFGKYVVRVDTPQ